MSPKAAWISVQAVSETLSLMELPQSLPAKKHIADDSSVYTIRSKLKIANDGFT
jgi:hypothetical protein